MVDRKYVGSAGERYAEGKFLEYGCPVFASLGDINPYDIVVELNNKLYKIQIKTSNKANNEKIVFNLRAETYKDKKYIKRSYSNKEIDYFALVNLKTKDVLLLDIKDAPQSEVSFRFNKAKNGQELGIRYYKDYLFENAINKIA